MRAGAQAASLPECYTMHKGVRILGLTRQPDEHTDRRLHQTLLMVLAVLQPGGLAPGGAGVQQAQRVRLIHAAIRRMVHLGLSASDPAHPPAPAGDSPVPPDAIARAMLREGFHWNVDADGQPINQEDLAFTLLTFGYVIPLGMSRFGVPVTDTDRLAFLQAWNVAGSHLGIRRELMAETVEDAEWLFAKIKSRQAGRTSDGAFLSARLVDFLAQDVIRLRLLRPLAPTLIRVFAGDDTARMLGLDARHSAGPLLFHKVVARVVRVVNTLAGVLGRFHPLLHLGDALGRRVIEALSRYTARGDSAPLAVPTDWLRAAQSLIANR